MRMGLLASLRGFVFFFIYLQHLCPCLQVYIENFMCHSQFTWTPNQRVNFVTGANGSGKSSMLQVLKLDSILIHNRFHDNYLLSGNHSWSARGPEECEAIHQGGRVHQEGRQQGDYSGDCLSWLLDKYNMVLRSPSRIVGTTLTSLRPMAGVSLSRFSIFDYSLLTLF